MIKKVVWLFLAVLTLYWSLYADWKVDISYYFGQRNDYQGAINYLRSHFEKIDEIDKPLVFILMAYSFERLVDKNKEYKWLGEYFEKCRGYRPLFDFLDETTAAAIINYIKNWEEEYPLIDEVTLINGRKYIGPAPPSNLIIGISIANDAYYKLSEEENILKGGLLKKGFNLISIEADHLFEKSGRHIYFLDVKSGDFILRKEIEIDIQLKSGKEEKGKESKAKNIEYKLSVFIGDELIVSSTKLHPYKPPLKVDIPLTRGKYQPFGPEDKSDPFKTDPFSSSFSIMNAVAGIYQLVKELKREKTKGKELYTIQKTQQIKTNFMRKNSEGLEEEIKAVITLKAKTLKTFSY